MKGRRCILIVSLQLLYTVNSSPTQWFPDSVRPKFWHGIVLQQKDDFHIMSDITNIGRSDLEIAETTAQYFTKEQEPESVLSNNDFIRLEEIKSGAEKYEPTTMFDWLTERPTQSPVQGEPTLNTERNSVDNEGMQLSNEMNIRLPDTIRPLHYTIKLQPFIHGNLSIHGFMEVDIEVLKNTSQIVLHIADIECVYHTAKIVPLDDGISPAIIIFAVDQNRQFMTATLNASLTMGKRYRYSMYYIAKLNKKPQGFHIATYLESGGKEKRAAVTIFQPTNARRAFPCFDEPALKATFDIVLVRERNMTTISNMPLRNTSLLAQEEDWLVDEFETTPPMSTYLVVLVIAELEHIASTNNDGLPIRVWARGEVLHRAEFSLQLTERTHSFFEELFNISYPLPKLDVVAVPSGLAMAFEGWGAILIYDEGASLLDDSSTVNHRNDIGTILAHEVAHQWFGNLVTPQWWTDLWLNEGFASYMENIALAYIKPEWDVEAMQVLKDLHEVMRIDSHLSSHPVSAPVYHPDKISQIFDRISYEKGSSIIRMMNSFLTEETFRKGVSKFLRNHKFGAANQDDLWESLTTAGHEDGILPRNLTVKSVMDSWTLQMGYPVISVIRNGEGTMATVSQERFLLSGNKTYDGQDYKWWVPLAYTTQISPNFTNVQSLIWLRNSSSHTIVRGLPYKDNWVIFNLQQTGFYRVQYDENNWDLLIQQLQSNHSVIDVLNRAQLIDDIFNLALTGQVSYTKVLNMTLYLPKEEEHSVWNTVFGNINHLNTLLANTDVHDKLKSYIISLLLPLFAQLGLQDEFSEDHWHEINTPDLTRWSCELGHVYCVQKAKKLYKNWMLDPKKNKPDPSNMKMVCCTAIANGGLEEWEFAWQQYKKMEVDDQKNILIQALSCNNDFAIKERYLNLVISPTKEIRSHDHFLILDSMGSRPGKNKMLWNFCRSHWSELQAMFGYQYDVTEAIILLATKNFNTYEDLNEVKAFKEEYENDKMVQRAIGKAIEETNVNIKWMEENYDVINAWLDENWSQ